MTEAPNSGAVVAMPTSTIPTINFGMSRALATPDAPLIKKSADLNKMAKEIINAAK
jgi:hypothetical protein